MIWKIRVVLIEKFNIKTPEEPMERFGTVVNNFNSLLFQQGKITSELDDVSIPLLSVDNNLLVLQRSALFIPPLTVLVEVLVVFHQRVF